MFRSSFFALLLLIVTSTVNANDAPWQIASEQLTAYGKLPSRISLVEEVFNSSKTLEEKTVIEAQLRRTNTDRIRFAVLSGSENGVVIDKAELKELDEILAEDDELPFIPFRAKDQKNISWKKSEQTATIDGNICQISLFEGSINNENYAGKVWFKKGSSMPLRVRWIKKSVPFSDGGVTIRHQNQIDTYKITEDGTISLPVTSKMHTTIEVESFLSSFTGNIHTTFHYYDYRPRAEL